VEVADQANEISAAPQVLAAINRTGGVVTGDALFTQRERGQQITQAGGDDVFPVKNHQPGLRQAIAAVLMPPVVSAGHSPVRLPERCTQTVDCGHGRIEYRYLTARSERNADLDWPQVGQVFRLQRVVQRLKTGKLRYEVGFGVTSLPAATCAPQRLMTLIRHHWHIENRLH
jgi:predicted transposase YbfD/YdcC